MDREATVGANRTHLAAGCVVAIHERRLGLDTAMDLGWGWTRGSIRGKANGLTDAAGAERWGRPGLGFVGGNP